MQYGDIVLASTKTGFIPNSIKWFTQSQFSHSLVTTPDILNTPMCIEAAEGGVDFTRFDDSYANNTDQGYEVWHIKVSQEKKDIAIVKILADLETSYGFMEYPWFMWRRLNLAVGRDIKGQDNWNNKGMICSQLCVAYLTELGLDPKTFDGYGKGSISPQDLQNIFKAHPDLFELVQSVRMVTKAA